jgi:hypothetical protein
VKRRADPRWFDQLKICEVIQTDGRNNDKNIDIDNGAHERASPHFGGNAPWFSWMRTYRRDRAGGEHREYNAKFEWKLFAASVADAESHSALR